MSDQYQLPTLERGDMILLKDGRTVRILSVYKPDGILRRVDCVDDASENPMRQPVDVKDVARILKKAPPKEAKKEALPPEQAVKEKVQVPAVLKKDIDERERETTASSKNEKVTK